VFTATTSTHRFFLKFGGADAIAAETAVLRAVAQLEVPVPVVAAIDLDGSVAGCPCLATFEVAGQPMNGDEPFFADIRDILDRLHATRVRGFGNLLPTGDDDLRGQDDTWNAALERRVEGARAVVAADLVPESLVDAVAHAVSAGGHEPVQGPRLLHGDFHPRHVYSEGGRITAVIDWGDATGGDPDYDVARLLHSTLLRSDMPTAIRVAASASSGEIDGSRLAKLLTYAAVLILWSMRGEYESGAPWPPWWPMQTRALEQVLSALEDAV
jgi:aminoglycoside phosphotransferase (APT) family kinase protein